MKNCPDEYVDNCLSYPLACKFCQAGDGVNSKVNYYSPREDILPEHPYKPSLEKRKRFRKARKLEKDAVKSIAKSTLRSGAAFGDGDMRLLDEWRVEYKDRGDRKSFNLTWREYTKGIQQGIDAYCIEIRNEGKQHKVYMLTEEHYAMLLALMKKETT